MRIKRRTLPTSASLAALGLLLLAPAAAALPGGPWASSSSPLLVKGGGGYQDGAAYGTWQGLREDQGRGSRVQNSSFHRHLHDDVGGGDTGTYLRIEWSANKNNCYVTSWSSAGATIGCSSGWWGTGSTNTGSTKSASWQYWEEWKSLDPAGSSMRSVIKVCENINAWPDICSSAYFLRGADY